MSKQDKELSYFCRVSLKAEAGINTIVTILLSLPVIAAIYGYKLVVVIGSAVAFIGERIARGIVAVLVPIGKGIIWLLKTTWYGFRWACRKIRYLVSIINWCAFRSIVRMVSVAATVLSSAYIIYEVYFNYKTTTIITGYFYDSNPMVYHIHIAIMIVLFSVSCYYNAWAYSKPEEIEFVCKRTWSLKDVRDMWNKK